VAAAQVHGAFPIGSVEIIKYIISTLTPVVVAPRWRYLALGKSHTTRAIPPTRLAARKRSWTSPDQSWDRLIAADRVHCACRRCTGHTSSRPRPCRFVSAMIMSPILITTTVAVVLSVVPSTRVSIATTSVDLFTYFMLFYFFLKTSREFLSGKIAVRRLRK